MFQKNIFSWKEICFNYGLLYWHSIVTHSFSEISNTKKKSINTKTILWRNKSWKQPWKNVPWNRFSEIVDKIFEKSLWRSFTFSNTESMEACNFIANELFHKGSSKNFDNSFGCLKIKNTFILQNILHGCFYNRNKVARQTLIKSKYRM